MEMSLKVPDCQIKSASSEQSYMLFHLHSLSFAVVKRRILLLFQTRPLCKNVSRYDTVLLNRLQIGHSCLTHSYLLSGDDSPTCQPCRIPLTVKHILVECATLRDVHEKYFTVSSLADLFNRADNHTVIGFIKETHFYHQL